MSLAAPRLLRRLLAGITVVATIATAAGATTAVAAASPPARTSTPIQHLVVIFQENVSFDHYFGTYPMAANTSGQTFVARPGTPSVNGLTPSLLTANPNGVNPRRYDPSVVADLLTCDQDHNYNDEQRAFNGGAMNKFPATVGNGTFKSPEGTTCVANDVMNYYDGNTVTALWNYAQALLHERQLVQHDLWAVVARARSTSFPATPAASTRRTWPTAPRSRPHRLPTRT